MEDNLTPTISSRQMVLSNKVGEVWSHDLRQEGARRRETAMHVHATTSLQREITRQITAFGWGLIDVGQINRMSQRQDIIRIIAKLYNKHQRL